MNRGLDWYKLECISPLYCLDKPSSTSNTSTTGNLIRRILLSPITIFTTSSTKRTWTWCHLHGVWPQLLIPQNRFILSLQRIQLTLHNGNCHDIQKTKEKVRTTATRLCARCRQNLFIICLVSKSKHHQKSDLDNEDFSSIHTARLLRSTLFCKHRRIVIDFACAVFECNGDQ